MKLALSLNVFGLLFCSNVSLIPGGENIAFEIKTNGVVVTGTYDINVNNVIYNPNTSQDIKKGDIIKRVNNIDIYSLETFLNEFNKNINDESLNITLYRKGEKLNRVLKLININNDIKTGLYVKDRLIGIGTVSFYDQKNNIYGALGHEVYDNDTSSIVDLREGTIYKSDVVGINSKNSISEKVADTSLETEFGSILINSNYGIFGDIETIQSSYTPLKLASKEDINLGEAYIKTVIKGNKVEEFKINITNLKKQDEIDVKGIEFDIVDNRLKELGGIYYGMSGSPIIQNNLLIGAVTHVKSSNTNSGYGLYMESMYEYALNQLIK